MNTTSPILQFHTMDVRAIKVDTSLLLQVYSYADVASTTNFLELVHYRLYVYNYVYMYTSGGSRGGSMGSTDPLF